jgi:stage IV sporulation protein B
VIPVKQVEILEIDRPMLVPCGTPFGIELEMGGAMVISTEAVKTADGSNCPAEDAGLEPGDLIQSVDGQAIYSNQDLQSAIASTEGASVTVVFTREDTQYSCTLTPVYATETKSYTAGIWVRDSSAGIGTLTFYEEATDSFGGLGHPICDSDTGDILPLRSGRAIRATIDGVIPGVAGSPGMLEGSFLNASTLGTLLCNNRCGVFGTLFCNPSTEEAIPMALKQEVQTGTAEILCTTSGSTPSRYTVEIESLDFAGTDNTKNMILRVTDPVLLEETGGIVQGMSGSPILQNGMLVGAVTHVFVDDPTRGYGIFCENMVRYGLGY